MMPRGKDLKPRKSRNDKYSPLDVVECKDCYHTFHRCALHRSGLCDRCAATRVVIAIHQMQRKRGPIYERWLAGCESAKINMEGGNHGQEND